MKRVAGFVVLIAMTAVVTWAVTALLFNIRERKQEAKADGDLRCTQGEHHQGVEPLPGPTGPGRDHHLEEQVPVQVVDRRR